MKIVKDFSEIKDMTAFLNSVVTNPVATEIVNTRTSMTTIDSNLNQINRDITSYDNGLLDLKRKLLLNNSEKARLQKKLDILEKVAKRSTETGGLDKYNATKFDEFLRPIGLRFFACHSVGDNFYFYFTREAKKISYVVTPPLMLRIRYAFSRDYGTYNLADVKAMPLVYFSSVNDYVHPHINSGSDMFNNLCLGNYFDILKINKVPTTFSNWQDHCLLVDQLLSTYNPDSPYIRIDELARRLRDSGYSINDRDRTNNYVSIDTGSKFVILADGLAQMSQYNPENILTKGMFDRFEKLVHDLDTKQIIEDAIAQLTTIYFSDDTEAYDRMCTFYNSLSLDIENFDEVGDWSEYDEENDCYYLTEESFDCLKEKWINALKEASTKGKSISIPKMSRELYEQYFGKEEEVKPTETSTVESTAVIEEV